jgi:uncharacterized membrane protein YuzA (DUF378 family)
MKKLSVLIVSGLAMFPVSVFALNTVNELLTPTPAPEPASLILIITGLAGVLGLRRIFKK